MECRFCGIVFAKLRSRPPAESNERGRGEPHWAVRLNHAVRGFLSLGSLCALAAALNSVISVFIGGEPVTDFLSIPIAFFGAGALAFFGALFGRWRPSGHYDLGSWFAAVVIGGATAALIAYVMVGSGVNSPLGPGSSAAAAAALWGLAVGAVRAVAWLIGRRRSRAVRGRRGVE